VLWASDVLVLPSQKGTEAFPLVILEAMLCGVIPIRTPASGAEDQISQGINGFIIPFGDATSLAQKLESVFSDPHMLSRMADASVSFGIKHFTLDNMLEKSVRLYKEMLCST
jgi:glycosyltransferase involved in cell wall biosynthesis